MFAIRNEPRTNGQPAQCGFTGSLRLRHLFKSRRHFVGYCYYQLLTHIQSIVYIGSHVKLLLLVLDKLYSLMYTSYMVKETKETPEKITSHYTAYRFCEWLDENTQVTRVQGWKVDRLEGGRATDLVHGNMRITLDVEELYSRRAEINDWINRFA